jgi:hypothetical protein
LYPTLTIRLSGPAIRNNLFSRVFDTPSAAAVSSAVANSRFRIIGIGYLLQPQVTLREAFFPEPGLDFLLFPKRQLGQFFLDSFPLAFVFRGSQSVCQSEEFLLLASFASSPVSICVSGTSRLSLISYNHVGKPDGTLTYIFQ